MGSSGLQPAMRRRGAWGAALLCASILCAKSARAEPTPTDKAVARNLMAEGRMLRNQGNLSTALKRFQSADEIMHVPTTGLEVARTEEAVGHLLDARATARRVLLFPIGREDPAPFQEAQSSAAALCSQLDERIPTVKFIVADRSSSGTPAVWVDGKLISRAEVGAAFRLDPGTHQVVARLGQLEASQSIVLRERDYQPIVLRMPATADEAKRGTAPSAVDSTWRTVGYVGLGLSSAALVTGAITGALAMASKRTAEVGCVDSRCPPPTWNDVERARNYATVSTIAFATSATALGLGLVGFALAPARPAGREAVTIRAGPRVGLGIVGVDGSF
jgi:hypothetical protein